MTETEAAQALSIHGIDDRFQQAPNIRPMQEIRFERSFKIQSAHQQHINNALKLLAFATKQFCSVEWHGERKTSLFTAEMVMGLGGKLDRKRIH